MPLTTEDWVEISNQCSRFCLALDGGDGDLMVSLFTDDGFIKDPERVIAGDEMRQFVTGKDRSKMRHLAGTLLIEGDGDEAQAKSYVYVVIGPNDKQFVIDATGTYEDKLVRQDGRWLFKERNIVRAHSDDLP